MSLFPEAIAVRLPDGFVEQRAGILSRLKLHKQGDHAAVSVEARPASTPETDRLALRLSLHLTADQLDELAATATEMAVQIRADNGAAGEEQRKSSG